jgi:hypothetical protein
MMRKTICVLVLCALVLTGCRTPTNERVLIRHEPGRRLAVRKAPYNGQYRLYATAQHRPTTARATPVVTERFLKGELIGFARDSAGALVAVVHGERIALDGGPRRDSAYVWTMQPDAGQIDVGRTAVLIIAVVVVVGVAVGAAASASSASSTTIAWPL